MLAATSSGVPATLLKSGGARDDSQQPGILASGPTPIGSSGLNRFTQDLYEDWRFQADEERSIEPISDCYALNVVGEDAWACTYTEFGASRCTTESSARGPIVFPARPLWRSQETASRCSVGTPATATTS